MNESGRTTQPQQMVYAEHGTGALTLDLFLPTQPAPAAGRPGLLFIHGGGWHKGSPQQFHWLVAAAAQRGYVAASVAYRLASVATFPAQLHDCQAAVRFMRQRAATWDMDPDRLGAIGSSAGGHLAACLGVRNESRDGLSSRVQCVVDIHGVHDFPHMARQGMLRESALRLFGGTFDQRADLWHEGSPIEFVDEQTAPMLLIHDPHDRTVPYEQSVRFAERLMHRHRPVAFLPLPGAGHGFVYNPSNEFAQRIVPDVWRWLDRFLSADDGQQDRSLHP